MGTFCVVVFISDSLLKIRPGSKQGSDIERNTSRFLSMAASLPLEVQMVLCNRMFGSSRDIISSRDSEPVFRKLAQDLS